jgi:hypothetical protein
VTAAGSSYKRVPVSARDHQLLHLAVPPIPAELPRGRGANAGPRRDRLLRDDPAVVCQVRAGIRVPAAPPPTPTRRQVAFISTRCWSRSTAVGSICGGPSTRTATSWDILVQPRRDAKAAKRFLRKLLKRQCASPRVLVTDKLRSYAVAHRELMPSVEHRQSRYLNRAENSHQPTRQRERALKRFKSIRHAQPFLCAFSVISPHFRPRRHLLSAAEYRQVMADRFAVWTEITGATTTAAA